MFLRKNKSMVILVGVLLISITNVSRLFGQEKLQLVKKDGAPIIKWLDTTNYNLTTEKPFLVFLSPRNIADLEEIPAIIGRYFYEQGYWCFSPKFPFRPGKTYNLITPENVHHSFQIPSLSQNEAPQIEVVYPTTDSLPRNLLKLYLHFNTKMGMGRSDFFISLIDENGDTIPNPFVQLNPELWNESRNRLTLWFDPGRIKRGLGPNEFHGSIFQTGKKYQLIIDQSWQNANGVPLVNTFSKTIYIIEDDRTQPNPRNWKIELPELNTRGPLCIHFNEPFDYHLLHKFIKIIHDQSYQFVNGTIEVSNNERLWKFTPNQKWVEGSYAIRINTFLEDLAGNNFVRLFDTDLFEENRDSFEEEFMDLLFALEKTKE